MPAKSPARNHRTNGQPATPGASESRGETVDSPRQDPVPAQMVPVPSECLWHQPAWKWPPHWQRAHRQPAPQTPESPRVRGESVGREWYVALNTARYVSQQPWPSHLQKTTFQGFFHGWRPPEAGAEIRPSIPGEITPAVSRSEEHTSELQSRENLVCRLLLEKKKMNYTY